MSFKYQRCLNCWHTYEYYQQGTIVPSCPFCGAGANGDKSLTSEEYYKSMGVLNSLNESSNKQDHGK